MKIPNMHSPSRLLSNRHHSISYLPSFFFRSGTPFSGALPTCGLARIPLGSLHILLMASKGL